MCDSCSKEAVDVLKMDFYSHMSSKRDEILDDDDMREAFGPAFEELIQNYASFVEKVFVGVFDADSIARRQSQWESRLASLIEQIEHGEQEQPEEPQQEKSNLHINATEESVFIITGPAKKSNPFAKWTNAPSE